MRKVLIAVLLLAATWSATISAAPTKTQRELAERLYQQGYQKGSSGDYKTAIELFKKALELNPAHFMAAFNMGGAYEASGDKQRALEQYLATAVLKPTFIEAYNQAGTLFLLFKRDYDAAIAQFTSGGFRL